MNIDWTGSKTELLANVDDAEIHGHLPSPLARRVRKELADCADGTYWLRINGDPNDDITWQVVLLQGTTASVAAMSVVLLQGTTSSVAAMSKSMEQALFQQSHRDAFVAGATAYAVACGHSPLFRDNEVLCKVRAEYGYRLYSSSGDETPPCNDDQIGPKQPDPQ